MLRLANLYWEMDVYYSQWKFFCKRCRECIIFKIMKMIAAIFLVLKSFLMIQPAISLGRPDNKGMMCKKMCGMVKKCDRKNNNHGTSNKENKKDCNSCNPFMPCTSGNCFLAAKVSISFYVSTGIEKRISFDDKVTSHYLVDCWHPPESYFL